MIKLVCILSLVLFSFAAKTQIQIAFMPNAGNFEVLPSFIKLAEYFSTTKGYGCVAVVHGADRNIWDKTSCFQTKYGANNGGLYLDKVFAAHNQLEEQYLLSSETFKDSFEILIDNFSNSKVLFDLERLSVDVLICDVSNFLCSYVAEKLHIKMTVYHSPTLPNYYMMDYFESSATITQS